MYEVYTGTMYSHSRRRMASIQDRRCTMALRLVDAAIVHTSGLWGSQAHSRNSRSPGDVDICPSSFVPCPSVFPRPFRNAVESCPLAGCSHHTRHPAPIPTSCAVYIPVMLVLGSPHAGVGLGLPMGHVALHLTKVCLYL